MADVAKVVTVIGNSPESFAKAADAAVQEAAKTLRGHHRRGRGLDERQGQGRQDHVVRTTVNIAFGVER